METKYTLDEIQVLIDKQITEGIMTIEELGEQKQEEQTNFEFIVSSSMSPENTLRNIVMLLNRVQEALRKNPSNIMFINIAMKLIDLQCRIQGMYQVKPELQERIDIEVNTYKERFISLAEEIISDKQEFGIIIDRLEKEGL